MSNFYVKFSDYKSQNMKVSDVFYKAGYYDRSVSIRDCASHLLFGNRNDGSHDLIFGNFCKDRFCPLCQARRSAQRAMELLHVLDLLSGQFLFLTLTVVNVDAADLRQRIDDMTTGFHDFIHDPRIKKGVLGYIRNLEVTYNKHEQSYHPHFHILLNVSDSYFSDPRQYLSRNEVLQVWKAYMHDDRISQVDIRKVRGQRLDKSIVEVTKYFTKFGDWIYEADCSSILNTFVTCLKSVNCTTMGGTIRKAVLQLRSEKSEQKLPFDEKIAAFIQNANSVYSDIYIYTYYPWEHGYSLDCYKLPSYVSGIIYSHPFFRRKFESALNKVYEIEYYEFLERKSV